MNDMNGIRKLLLIVDATILALLGAIAVVGVVSMLSGCTQYKAGGTIVTIGEEVMLPEIAEPGLGLSLRLYESIHGARIWSRENNRTDVVYTNSYSTSYFGIVSKEDNTVLSVTVTPNGESRQVADVPPAKPD